MMMFIGLLLITDLNSENYVNNLQKKNQKFEIRWETIETEKINRFLDIPN